MITKGVDLVIIIAIWLLAAGAGVMIGYNYHDNIALIRGDDMSKNKNMIEKVEVRLGYTLNAGNYESVRVDLGVTRFMAEGESTVEVVKGLRESIRKELQKAGAEELRAFQKPGKRG